MNNLSQDAGAPLKSSYAPGLSPEPSTAGGRGPADALIPVGQVFEALPLTFEHLKSCLALFFVFVIEAWEMMIIVYTSPLISKDFNLGPVAVGNLIGAIFVGMGIGSIVWGPISDRIGRKKSIIYSLVLYGVVSVASVFSPDYSTLYALRLLSGVVAAGMLVVTFPYFTELLPVRSRGPFTVYLAAGWPIGMLLALGATVWMMSMGWRWVIGMSSLAALWALVVAYLVPESPYWLAGKGRQEQARAVILRLSRGATVISPQRQLHVEEVKRGVWSDLLSGRVLAVTLLQIAINFTFAWGYWGLQSWLPTLLQQRGLSLPQSYSFIAISALCMIPGYMSASYLTGKFGRKKVMIAYVALSAIAGYAFANTQTMTALYASNFALAFFSLGAWGVWDTWVAELYSTRLRTVGYSWAVLAQRLANIAAPTFIGLLVAQGSSFNTTTTIINLFMIATVLMALFLPETEGKDLA
ncbi:Putative niacin/nicotinamide transporter NaiP [Paraburkholderia domus]|jgi:Arabinose efflux permease|uniref:MFS transporter n=1 Tax=Paraburkholderia domus TaxID=2793075 RepID=UPI0019138C7E|nr:MFS transporter [Paraburkholderia domus]MBK5051678.1 MFS transporter [Burkholderia sp. R-70006]MCI0151644.1 MFS transporter [Paraburkholderia sediminicola]CAE6789712.1 Putative niacin/nicotinamide transporter NaiP [Paraburkholderia domus]CAE6793705.1 Putative niacin/nicotinamide transporter NaiP [Paraburkholderia domus]